jgi:hypothetical protein
MATQATGVTTQLTTTAVALVTAGANESCVITSVVAMNIDTTSRFVTLYQVPSAGSATTANQMTVQTVFRGQSVTVPVGAVVLANGAALYAKADANTAVNLSVNYYRSDQQA